MKTPAMRGPLKVSDVVEGGVCPGMIGGGSRVSGRGLAKGSLGESGCGLWICTPCRWESHLTNDEFSHFPAGRCTCIHDSGDAIEITPGTAAFLSENRSGVCKVHATITKAYMIR